MDWTSGYASDVEYTAGFYQEQSPHWLNFVCALAGIEPVPLERGYTYFELGFGRGLTVNLLAAANPEGRFYAADFNPGHVAGARALADQAGLTNLSLLENSFADLAQGAVADLPQFDFITLHGIYTWVTAENRRHIVDFIGRYLKPGGVVYTSYNAMPGWTPALPLQRLLIEYGDAFPNRSDVQIAGAADFLQKLVDADAAYFVANPGASVRQQRLKTSNQNYLVHEYMHKHWQPLYHADVARDFAGAKLEFAASAEFPHAYPELYLSEEKRELIKTLPDPAMRETLKDYCMNTSFRKDVFVRGARRMGRERKSDVLANVGVVLTVDPRAVNYKLKLSTGEVNGTPAVFDPVCEALARGPCTIGQLIAQPAIRDIRFVNVVQAVALLVTSGQVALYPGAPAPRESAPAHRMNRALASHVAYGDEYQALCSPLLGTGIGASYLERLTFMLITSYPETHDVDELAKLGWKVMERQGRNMVKDGITLDGAEANLAELRSHVRKIRDEKLPIWRALHVV